MSTHSAPPTAPFVPSHPNQLLTSAECAAWLRVNPRELGRMGVPRTVNRHKIKLYRVRDVELWLSRQAKNGGR
jgi:hypothetical protein